ncbi:hypothetical protein BC936DRAFT_137929 [Jimgerdemannia flammicorona]|uniref:Uncharacterized protein n=1 Tax=Jimgerdemannia flammicorona TaxID=994334 RepID=A0A433CWD8_9FUNG|nr:hypothetical protein BC936DRAFT_137929 [Jimgerdemannia flammicorona]
MRSAGHRPEHNQASRSIDRHAARKHKIRLCDVYFRMGRTNGKAVRAELQGNSNGDAGQNGAGAWYESGGIRAGSDNHDERVRGI